MASSTPRVGERRPGGRSARTRTAVLAATADVLSKGGYDALSIEAVATRAGVHKTTVYRRWPTKAALVADTIRERSLQQVPIPETGSLHGDLQALARAVAANIGSEIGGNVTRTLVAAAATSLEIADRTSTFWTERLALTATIVERAIERGEIPADSDPNLIIETLIGPLYVRLLLTGEPIDATFADRVVALVTTGCHHGGPSETSSHQLTTSSTSCPRPAHVVCAQSHVRFSRAGRVARVRRCSSLPCR